MPGVIGSNIEITMSLKEVKITITVSEEFAEHIRALAKAKVIPRAPLPPPQPPVSQAEWLAKTPEGRQFAQDCMKFKYVRLKHKQLQNLAKTLYYKTYDIKEKTGPARRYAPEMSYTYVQNKMLVDVLIEGLNFRPKPQLVINNK